MSGESPRSAPSSFALLLVCAACAGEPFRAATETSGGAGAASAGSGFAGEAVGGAAGSVGGSPALAGSSGGGESGAIGAGAAEGGTAAAGTDGGGESGGKAGDNTSAGTGAGGLVAAGGTNGGAPAGGRGGASGSPGNSKAVEVQVSIASDEDDAVWVNGSDERLKYAEDSPNIEVGDDAEGCRAALRFALPVPEGATIVLATLRLSRTDGTVAANATLGVQVYDSLTVPAFQDDHDSHSAESHDPAGIFPRLISGFRAGNRDSTTDSPNLAELVQYLVDRPDYVEGSRVGFVLSPDSLGGWVMFADSASGGRQASLRVTYRLR